MALKGFVTVYVNIHPDLNQDPKQMLDLVSSYNKEMVERLRSADYEVLFVATTKEACRIEKIDLDKPYPRVVSGQLVTDEAEEEVEL